ncbi:PKD domain-containing protein [Ferruginibacter sp. SUN002]|uniref:PKD domain-containing protein n=1 Tax=Ferruginibacter sp. SUN002 TaxID=2937789 RepID=UPI003D35F1A5
MIAKIAIRACCLSLLFVLSFTVKAQLKADFSSFPESGCSPLLVQFFDNSTGNPDQWRWDLGNGTTSFLRNPSVTYFTPGQYAVKLVVRNASGADSIVKTNFITVYAKPLVEFSSNVTAGCYPLPVQFTDNSVPMSGTIMSWQWDFGDGTGSTEKNPNHIYEAEGNYNVTLRVINSNGCVTTLAKDAYIQITSGVSADFTNNMPLVCGLPATIDFQNASTGTGSLTYNWNFGDGSSSTATSPSHTYSAAGNYIVQLITKNAVGCSDTLSKTISIVDGNGKASFSSNSNFICLGKGIDLKITSTATPSSVMWDFGDGTTSTQFNPTKVYSAPGIYRIKLVEFFGGCSDSAFKTVNIATTAKASFSNGNTVSCKAPLTVNFTNSSTSANTYKWYFGDGDSSTVADPVHIYTKTGVFNVTLIATNSSGCADTIRKTGLVQIVKPKLRMLGLPDSSCAPFTKTFAYAEQEIDIWNNYKWDFGDGTTSTLKTPTHTYTDPGVYTVSLSAITTDGCTDTVVMGSAIRVSTKPTPGFDADREACAIIPIQFADQTVGEVTRWLWDFGDGATSIQKDPKHQYSDTGYFDIKLKVWNGGCVDSLQIDSFIYIKAPIANFDVPVNCSNSFERVFTDKSIGADTWNWDFGDGTTSTEQNPVHTYTNEGSYLVTLVVYNIQTGCDYTTTKEVIILNSKANFYGSDTIICKNNSVTFTVPTANRVFVTNYEWDFGDGSKTTSVGGVTTHNYKQSGLYDVTLVITNTLGCKDTLVKQHYVRVDGPTAKFTTTVLGSCLNNTVIFTDASTDDGMHPIETWRWNYGDGKRDTLTSGPFEHAYSSPGRYNISLVAIDNKGCYDSFNIAVPLVISKPLVDFDSKDRLSCPGKPIAFIDHSIATDARYLWNFGDGTTSTDQSPSHLYTSDGLFDVKLVLTDKYGCKDSLTRSAYISIVTPKTDFSMSDSLSTCPPLVVDFKDLSNVGVSRKWDFGDNTFSTLSEPSHFYNYPGIYIVKLTTTGPGGCVDVKERKIEIRGPRGNFTYNPVIGCKDLKVDFVATTQDDATFIWDYSDGTTVRTADSVMSHTYTFYGAYVPRLILVDKQGCHVPIVGDDTIKVNGADAKFNFVDKALCDSGYVSFVDSTDSYDNVATYKWDMGDGVSSSDQNASHYYTQTGTYYPKLIVTTVNGCTDTATAKVPVKIVASPKATITNFNNGCIPLNTGFTGSLLVPDTSAIKWQWDFGNGNTSTLQTPPSQNYPIAGSYTINLTATNSSGCFDTVVRRVEAYPIPTVNAGADAWLCLGSIHTLNATGADSYSWKADNTLSCLDCARSSATPADDTKYFVTGTTIYGCSATDSVLIQVQKPQQITFSTSDTLCKGETSKLMASGTDKYLWTPATGLSDPTSANPIARPDVTTTYTVIGSDARNCFSDTGSIKIKVYPIPTVSAGQDLTINIGKSITIKPTISDDVTEVNWSPKTWVISSTNDLPMLTVKPKETTQYNIEVKNPGGCKSSDNVTIFVTCDGSNIFMPNTFSPNNDGANDLYYPRGSGLFAIKGMRIFNRWGEIVYERNNFKANDPSAAWNGTYKGSKLTPDVFVYTIDIICDNGSVLTFKGNIALIQ